jgi:putative iron-dependent peroxidase
MLTNMFIGNPPGNTDRILDFSTAITGGLFFAPSAHRLENLAPGGSEAAGAPGSTAGASGEQSLRIGSLRDQGR